MRKVVKIGAKVISHGRYLVFHIVEVAVPRELFRGILDRIASLRPPDPAPCSAVEKNRGVRPEGVDGLPQSAGIALYRVPGARGGRRAGALG